jgi:hypothetical protein
MGAGNPPWAQLAAAGPSKHDAIEGTNNDEETITSPTKIQTVQPPVTGITDETSETISSPMETSSNKQPIPQNITYTAGDTPEDNTRTKHMETSPEAPSPSEHERPTIPQQVHDSKQQEVGLTHQQGSHTHHENDNGRNTELASNNVEINRAETSDSVSLRGKKQRLDKGIEQLHECKRTRSRIITIARGKN